MAAAVVGLTWGAAAYNAVNLPWQVVGFCVAPLLLTFLSIANRSASLTADQLLNEAVDGMGFGVIGVAFSVGILSAEGGAWEQLLPVLQGPLLSTVALFLLTTTGSSYLLGKLFWANYFGQR